MPKDKDILPAKPEIAEKPSEVHGSTHVAIAFPFSNINLHQPMDEIRELTALVVSLAEELADFRPSPGTKALAERAQELAAKLSK